MFEKFLSAVEGIEVAIGDLQCDPVNSFGQTVGDELHDISYQLGELVTILEKIYTRMPVQE
jgi:hypothetical protein